MLVLIKLRNFVLHNDVARNILFLNAVKLPYKAIVCSSHFVAL
jgi:uncharacterized membrane protein